MTSALNGAGVGFGTIALAGVAFAVAGAISMFFSTYLSRRSELKSLQVDMAREEMEFETEPEEEKSEMRGLLKRDGYTDREVEMIIQRLAKDKNIWLKEMLRRELSVNVEDAKSDPVVRPLFAGISFLLLALLALAPYLFAIPRPDALFASVLLSLAALFALGSRAFVPGNFEPASGLESALVGALAGALLYLVGFFISVA